PFYELLDADSFRDGWKQPRVSWSNYWSPDPAVWRVRTEPARAPRVTPSGRPSGAGRFIPIVEPDDDYDDPAWRMPGGRGRVWGAWRWWLLAAAAPTGAVTLGLLTQQGAQPLRKTELVRLLATKARSKADVVALLRRNCVTFRPSERDRADLRAAGADDPVLGAIDQCLRARAAPAPTPAP